MHDSSHPDDEGDPLATDEKQFSEVMRDHSKAIFNTVKLFKETIESEREKSPEVFPVAMKSAPTTNQENGNPKAVIFLADVSESLELRRTSVEESRWQPLINPSVDDPALSAQILSEWLKKASKLIVRFGEVAQAWVDGRLREALHIALNTPNCPLKK